MSYTLEFLAINIDDVKKYLESGDDTVLNAILTEGNLIYDGDPDDEETGEDRKVWGDIAHSFNGGKLGKYLSTQIPFNSTKDIQTDAVSDMKAYLFSSLLQQFGKPIGGVSHSSNSGDIFRNKVFSYLNQSGLLGKIDSTLLLNRPLFNQVHLPYPGWGGLSKSELAGIQMDKLKTARPTSGDTDIDSWCYGILDLIEEVKLRDLDLVTIYD